MTDINIFEHAINTNETNDLFRGIGKYFVACPDYEGHVHGAHMGGNINTFVLASNTNADKFKTAFIMFLQDLKLSKDDVDHLLTNMSSYFAQKNRGNLAGTDLFEGEDNKETNILKNYLLSVYTSEIFNEVAEQLARHAKFIENKGSSILKESLQELVN